MAFNPKKKIYFDLKPKKIDNRILKLKESHIQNLDTSKEKYSDYSSVSSNKLDTSINEIIKLIVNDFIFIWLQNLVLEKENLKIIIK